jgi:hypothetical protein
MAHVKDKDRKNAFKPDIFIDWNKVEVWLMKGGDGRQIAAELGIHWDTLYDRCLIENKLKWSDYSALKRSKGDLRLHCKQYDRALEGSDKMLSLLGEHRLGQCKKIDTTINLSPIEETVIIIPSNDHEINNNKDA